MSRSNLLRLLIIGAPGSGKGTISSKIVKTFDVLHFSSGDMIRAQIAKGTPIGLEAKQFVKEGRLVPDPIVVKLVAKELTEHESMNWLLDGFPRTSSQAEVLSEMVSLTCVVHLNVPFDEIVQRISQRWIHLQSGRVYNLTYNPPKMVGKDDVTGEDLVQRSDDRPEAVKARLEEFSAVTAPLLDYYKKKKLLVSFSGRESDVIWPEVKQYLEKHIIKRVH